MMNFIILALCFAVAILLAEVISVFIMLNKHVVNWYLKKVLDVTFSTFEEYESKTLVTSKDEEL